MDIMLFYFTAWKFQTPNRLLASLCLSTDTNYAQYFTLININTNSLKL